jgi:hypothetical protein
MDYSNLNDQEIKALLMQYDSEMRKLSFQMQVIQSTIQKLHECLNASSTDIQIKSASVNKVDGQSEDVAVPKLITGVEYPKKRTAKVELTGNNSIEIKERKKRGPKPKNIEMNVSSAVKERKKPGPKPKDKVNNSATNKESKKRGRKSKSNANSTSNDKPSTKVKKKPNAGNNSKRKYTKENPWPLFVMNTLSKYNHLMNSAQLYELADEENAIKNYGLDAKEVRSMISRALHQLSNNKKAIVKFDIKGSKSYNYGLTDWMNDTGEITEQYLP